MKQPKTTSLKRTFDFDFCAINKLKSRFPTFGLVQIS